MMPVISLKKTFGRILLDMIPVILGVYIGLLANQWSETRKLHKEKEQTRLSLLEEISNNRDRINKVIEYHKMLRDSSWAYHNNPPTLENRPTFFRGLQVSSLPEGAYQTAILSESINLFTQKDIRMITDLYAAQHDYNEFAKLALTGLITQDMLRDDNVEQLVRYIGITMTDLHSMEMNLLQAYEQVEKVLNTKK